MKTSYYKVKLQWNWTTRTQLISIYQRSYLLLLLWIHYQHVYNWFKTYCTVERILVLNIQYRLNQHHYIKAGGSGLTAHVLAGLVFLRVKQAHSQKIMVGGSFEGNMDLFLWNHSANHRPGAVNELIFYGACKPAYMRANCKHTKYMNLKKSALYYMY